MQINYKCQDLREKSIKSLTFLKKCMEHLRPMKVSTEQFQRLKDNRE